MFRLASKALVAGIALALMSCTVTRRLEAPLEFERSAVAVIDHADSIELVCARGTPLTVVVQLRWPDLTLERTLELTDGASVRIDPARPPVDGVGAPAPHVGVATSVRLDLLRFGEGRALVLLTIEGDADVEYDARTDDPDFE
ncbi:MAG: hypothetical protein IT459_21790 [Planctomycetes bacterium]|nr:hypothetical protein [Planctomycetota bacterium]